MTVVRRAAMACALPAIVSNHVGSHQDLILKGRTGEVFEFGHVEGLASCMLRAAADPVRLKRMGLAAREVIKDYSIKNLTQATLNALQLL